MISMAQKKFIPSVIAYTKQLADSINAIKAAAPAADVSVQTTLLTDISALLVKAQAATTKLQAVNDKANAHGDAEEIAKAFRFEVVPAMEAFRAPIDQLEVLVSKELWPVPTYGDLLFEV